MTAATPAWWARHGFAVALLALAGLLVSAGAPRWWPPTDAPAPAVPAPPDPPAVPAPPDPPAVPAPPDPAADPQGHARAAREAEIRLRFDQAVVMLHARRYEHAATALDRVLRLNPRLPEAHANLGFALLGLQRAAPAQAAFEQAIDLRPAQANAYYGLAMALEQRGDLPAALGAMRSYLHLSRADDTYRAKARAALWEWEQRIGRGASGTGAAAAAPIPGTGNR